VLPIGVNPFVYAEPTDTLSPTDSIKPTSPNWMNHLLDMDQRYLIIAGGAFTTLSIATMLVCCLLKHKKKK